MNDRQSPPPEPHINYFGIWLKGAFISNTCGFACLAILILAQTGFDSRLLAKVGEWTSGVLVASTFLTLPFAMGFGAALFWKPAKLGGGSIFGWTLCNLLVSLGGAVFVLHEGVICLIMASPLILLLMWFGCVMGTAFWSRNSFLGASVLPLLVLIGVVDASQPHRYVNQVVTEMHSDAPPEKLWTYAAHYPYNNAPPEAWLWSIGLPYPLEAKGQAEVGGRRDCTFSGGVTVGERVVQVQPNKMLEFVVDKQPNHPEILHHFQIVRARMELLPDGRGGTNMRATGWYALNVYPSFYFGPWCDMVIHALHERVFLHMDRLAHHDLISQEHSAPIIG